MSRIRSRNFLAEEQAEEKETKSYGAGAEIPESGINDTETEIETGLSVTSRLQTTLISFYKKGI